MITRVNYTCIGSEGQTINIPAAGGKEIVAILVDGFSKQAIVDYPEDDDHIQVNVTRGEFTLFSPPFRGLNILVINRMRSEDPGGLSGETNLNDFLTSDFAQGDFF